jgi:hypothetical protein
MKIHRAIQADKLGEAVRLCFATFDYQIPTIILEILFFFQWPSI